MPSPHQSTYAGIDTGQNDTLMTQTNPRDTGQEKERKESMENEFRNQQKPEEERGHLRLLLEIDYYEKEKEFQEKMVPTTLYHAGTLIAEWIKEGLVEGVCALDSHRLEENLENIENWAPVPRVIKKKSKTTVECMFDLKTTASAFQLYQNQKKRCDEKLIKISTKNTDMEHVQRIGFLSGPHVQLAASPHYVKEINEEALVNYGSIEIKKRITCEKGVASKALMVHAIVKDAAKIDKKLVEAKFKGFRCLSHKLSDSDQRLAAMHNNDMINVKARFETLHNTNLKETIFDKTK